MNPPAAILIYLASLVALLLGVGWVSTKIEIPPELRRKTVHVGMGLSTLTFPLAFDSALPVAALALLSTLLLVFLRRFPSLKCSDSIHGVRRKTWGDFYFVLGVLAAFALVGNHPVYYPVTILTLTFADPAAALVGKWSDPRRIRRKTAAGSLAFLIVAFACAILPLGFASLSITAIYTALGFSVSLACVEALSHRGSDNFTIPITGATFLLFPLSSQIILAATLLTFTLSTSPYGRHRPNTFS